MMTIMNAIKIIWILSDGCAWFLDGKVRRWCKHETFLRILGSGRIYIG
jgi:hypothetical protein